MLEILKLCEANNCIISFSFEIPLFITISIRNYKLARWTDQALPWDHIYDKKVYDCVEYMIDKIKKANGIGKVQE